MSIKFSIFNNIKKNINYIISIIFLVFLIGEEENTSSSEKGTTGSIGTVTLNGQVYNQLSLRPEIPIGDLGLGLDIYLYFNDKGMYWDSWNFSSLSSSYRTIIDKIYYLRWGRPGDGFHLMAGALPSITLGNGILVNNYSNIMEYPQVRQVGLNIQAHLNRFKIELISSNIKSSDPGILGFRASTNIISSFSVGLSGVIDSDQLSGLQDSDGDRYPDYYDPYPNDTEKQDGRNEALEQWETLTDYLDGNADFESWFLISSFHNEYNPQNASKDPISGFALDLSYMLNSKTVIYSQLAFLNGSLLNPITKEKEELGMGIVPLGLRAQLGPIQFLGEYRMGTERFIFSYWDRVYDLNRVSVLNSGLGTRESQLYQYGKLNGFYSEVDMSFINLFNFVIGYQNMQGEKWDADRGIFKENETNQSLSCILSLNPAVIPKVGKVEAFYQQSNVENPFEFNPDISTLLGYDLGIEMSAGMMLVYKARTTYIVDLDEGGSFKPVKSIQIETQFIF